MAESSRFWQTSGTGDGPAGGYSQAQMAEIYRALLVSNLPATQAWGVSAGYLNELAVSGTSSPLTVATGAAHVYGFFYINTTPVTVEIPTPSSATRVDRIVLRADWATQTVRIARLAGVEGAGGPPAATQVPGDKYEISLASILVTTGGVITLTDQRWFLNVVAPGGVSTAKLADGAVTTAKIALKAVTVAEIADNTITAGQIAANAVGSSELADSAVDTAAIVNAAVTTAKIADNNVTTAKIAPKAVTAAKLADATITAAQIANDTITATQIAANAVGSSELADNAVDSAAIANLAVTTAKIAAKNVTAAQIADATITATQLANSAVANAKLADDAVTRAKLHPTSFMPALMVTSSANNDFGTTQVTLALGTALLSGYTDSALSNHASGITIAVAGLYLISFKATVISYDNGQLLVVRARIGTTVVPGSTVEQTADPGQWTLQNTFVAELTASQVLSLQAWSDVNVLHRIEPGDVVLSALLIAPT